MFQMFQLYGFKEPFQKTNRCESTKITLYTATSSLIIAISALLTRERMNCISLRPTNVADELRWIDSKVQQIQDLGQYDNNTKPGIICNYRQNLDCVEPSNSDCSPNNAYQNADKNNVHVNAQIYFGGGEREIPDREAENELNQNILPRELRRSSSPSKSIMRKGQKAGCSASSRRVTFQEEVNSTATPSVAKPGNSGITEGPSYIKQFAKTVSRLFRRRRSAQCAAAAAAACTGGGPPPPHAVGGCPARA